MTTRPAQWRKARLLTVSVDVSTEQEIGERTRNRDESLMSAVLGDPAHVDAGWECRRERVCVFPVRVEERGSHAVAGVARDEAVTTWSGRG